MAIPFATSLTPQAACKALSHMGCGKIGCLRCCAPWLRRPSYDLRREPCNHPDFTSNALHGGLVQRFLIIIPGAVPDYPHSGSG